MSKAAVAVVGQLALDFTPPPPPIVAVPQPPRRPSFDAIYSQRLRIDRVAKALEAKLRAVLKPQRERWDVRDIFGQVAACRIDLLLADVTDLVEIGRWRHAPDVDEMWDVMRSTNTPHGACLLKRCARTGHRVLLADRHAQGGWEERLDAI